MGRKIKRKQDKRAKKKELGWLPSSKHATESARATQLSEEDLIREDEDDGERHSEEHRRQETMATLNSSIDEVDEGGQSNHGSVGFDEDIENVQNESVGVNVEVEILVSGTSLNLPLNEETSDTRDRE